MNSRSNNPKTPKKTCLQSCVSLLEYADNTERQLYEKLGKRSYKRAEITAAIEYLQKKRLYDERDYAFRYALSAAKGKRWGPRRILLSMREKGFRSENIEAVKAAMDDAKGAPPGEFRADSPQCDKSDIENLLSSLDFLSVCAILISKALSEGGYSCLCAFYAGEAEDEAPLDREERQKIYAQRQRQRQKLYAALLRRGFDMQTVKEAEEIVRERLRADISDAEDGENDEEN